MSIRKLLNHRFFRGVLAATLAIGLVSGAFVAQAAAAAKSGTMLAAYKTVDICELPDGNWRYSGEIAVWNEGAVDTQGFTITDCIQNKTGSGQFADVYCAATFAPPLTLIPSG